MTSNSVPIPDKLNMTGNLATEWKRFCSQWKNYEVATNLATANKKKRAAMLLACVGKEAFETFQTMEVADEADREDVDKVIAAFQNYCVGEVNVTYDATSSISVLRRLVSRLKVSYLICVSSCAHVNTVL
jgi:hypothetical protein